MSNDTPTHTHTHSHTHTRTNTSRHVRAYTGCRAQKPKHACSRRQHGSTGCHCYMVGLARCVHDTVRRSDTSAIQLWSFGSCLRVPLSAAVSCCLCHEPILVQAEPAGPSNATQLDAAPAHPYGRGLHTDVGRHTDVVCARTWYAYGRR